MTTFAQHLQADVSDPQWMAGGRYIAASRTGRGGVAWTSSFL